MNVVLNSPSRVWVVAYYSDVKYISACFNYPCRMNLKREGNINQFSLSTTTCYNNHKNWKEILNNFLNQSTICRNFTSWNVVPICSDTFRVLNRHIIHNKIFSLSHVREKFITLCDKRRQISVIFFTC